MVYATIAIMHRRERNVVEVKSQLSMKKASSKAEAEGMLLAEVKKDFPAMEGWNIGSIDSIELTPRLMKDFGYHILEM